MWARGGIKGRVDQHLIDARSSLPPRLRAAFKDLLAERRLLTPDPAPYFGVLGHPLFELPMWLGERLRDDGAHVTDDDLSNALGVSALGYLHARAHDDWLDATQAGGAQPGGIALVALAEALLARCTRLLVGITRDSVEFWARHGEIMDAYAEALLHTAELRYGQARITRATFEALLAQSRPLAIPSLALLDRAGRWDLAPLVEEFVFTATAASQLFNDLTDSFRDREAGHRTYAGERLDVAGSEQVWRELLDARPGAFAECVAEALAFQDRAARAARRLGLHEGERWLLARREALEGLAGSIRQELLIAFTERLAASDEQDHRAPRVGTGRETAP